MFIGPYEHHSNELPWRESIADVVTIHEDADGHIDVDQLAAELEQHADRPLKIGSFSAASNVTGIVTDTHRITRLLHAHGALAFWDFAAAAPYVDIEMNPRDGDPARARTRCSSRRTSSSAGPAPPACSSSAARLLTNTVPDVVGGGTVSYVNPQEHRYILDAGAPRGGRHARPSSSRSAPAWSSRSRRPSASRRSAAHEEDFLRRAVSAWHDHPAIEVLGNLEAERLSIVSFVVTPAGRSLPAPQPGGLDPQRPVRHPEPRRLLLRRAVRPPAARHRPGALPRVRAGDHRRVRGHQARLGAGQLQLLPQRARLRVRRATRSPWSPTTAPSWPGSTRSTRRPASGTTAPVRSNRRCASPRWATTRTAGSPTRASTTPRRRARSPATWPRQWRCSSRCPSCPTAPANGSAPTSSTCAGSTCPWSAWNLTLTRQSLALDT